MIAYYLRDADGILTRTSRDLWDKHNRDHGQQHIAANTSYREGRTPIRVSTTFHGVSEGPDEGPLGVFQSMIIGGPLDLNRWWWNTEREARDGHFAICQHIVDGTELP